MKGIRRLSPDPHSEDEQHDSEKLETPKKKKIDSSKACSEYQFSSMLQLYGVDKEMQTNSK